MRAPAVETFKPPFEISWRVPVLLPIVTVPVPVVAMVTLEAPALARSVAPVEVSVVNFPVEAAEFPIGVPLIDPNPEAIEPEESAPTLVSDEVTTLDASVVPLMSPAAFTVKVASGKVIVRVAEGSAMANVVLFALTVAPSNTNGEAPEKVALPKASVPEVAERLRIPVVRTKPFEAVKSPAETIVPEPVEEMFAEVVMSFVVETDPNPEAMEPDDSAPTPVSEEVTTLEASVVPLISPAAFIVIVASGKVIVRSVVGSVMANVDSKASTDAPSKTNADPFAMVVALKSRIPDVAVKFNVPVVSTNPLEAVRVCETVRAPLFVVVIPVLPKATEVAVDVPRLKAPAASIDTVLFEVRLVAPVPVRVALPAAMPKRVLPEVTKFNPLTSVVPKVAVAPKALPD